MRSALELAGLGSLMERTSGDAAVRVAVIDGPIAADHPDLTGVIRPVGASRLAACALPEAGACGHGTFVAGILSARRGSAAPAICPGCTLLVRPIFTESRSASVPATRLAELADAIHDVVEDGARVINLSAVGPHAAEPADRRLLDALDRAAARGVIVVAAAGNQGRVGSTHITRHRSVVPVVAADIHGLPLDMSTLGASISRRGLLAPGQGVVSLAATGGSTTLAGTSVAAPFVTGTIALLWSLFPHASAAHVTEALLGPPERRRRLIPPALDAAAAHQALASALREWQVPA